MKTQTKWGVGLLLALAASLGLYESSNRVITTPYQDIGGVWTVCDGITGTDVVPGRTYTATECRVLLARQIEAHLDGIAKCAPVRSLTLHEQFAFGHLAYSIGVGKWCGSTMAALVRAGRPREACAQITRWVFVAGRDCRIAANKCAGIVKRRLFERGVCEGTITPEGLAS